jgi:hypothetical protein
MSAAPLTLLLTSSVDDVSDLIVTTLGAEHVFRYNLDHWQDYKLRITGETIELENAQGRRITDADVAKVYRRRASRASEVYPDRPLSDEDRYMEEEVSAAWNEIMNLFHAAGKVVLVNPFTWLLLGKLQQLRIASKHFPLAPYSFLINRPDALRPGVESVVKSFNFKYGAGNAFYSKKVREDQLDPRCPWFLTDLIEAQWDVTVVFVRDQLFAFALDRSTFLDKTIDWRLGPVEHALRAWQPLDLPQSVADGIFAFMRDAGAHYARLDFLRAGNNYIFLEANFAGEWGWLDPQGRHGLRNKILREIDPRTPCVGCP